MPSKLSLGAISAASLAQVTSAGSGTAWYPYDANNWASQVTDANAVCKDGNAQSPIDFPECPGTSILRSAPSINWTTQKVNLENNGHTVVMNIRTPNSGNNTLSGGMEYSIAGITKTYTILQCHFHYGSEHFIGHEQSAFEAHCVHKLEGSNFGQRYGVFGTFFKVSTTESTYLKQIEDDLPSQPSRRLSGPSNVFGDPLHPETGRRMAGSRLANFNTAFDFTKLVADMKLQDTDALQHYWNYEGSFTTPPCTEAVDFYIYQTKAHMTQAQLDKFKAAIAWGSPTDPAGNFRPPQPFKNRAIYGCTTEPPSRLNDHWYPYQASTWGTAVGIDSNPVCNGGSMQSPIDFAACLAPMDQQALQISWKASQTVDFKNNGHTVVLEMESDAGLMTSATREYKLLQCHFHWGSEHTVGGKQYPFEAHCVHQQSGTEEAPHYGVFGVFFEVGSTTNSFLADLTGNLPQTSRRLSTASTGLNVFGEPMAAAGRRLASGGTSTTVTGLNVNKLYNGVSLSQFWNYQGSFTTPPCTEAVDFYIMMQPAYLTMAQLNSFKSAIGWVSQGGNFRPPQKMHSRVVGGCAKLATTENIIANQAENLGATIRAAIESTLDKQLSNAIDDQQGGHTTMLTVLIVLAAVIVVLSMAMLGLMFKVMKNAKPAAAKSAVDGQPIGRTEV